MSNGYAKEFKRLSDLRIRTRDVEVVWACDFAMELIAKLNAAASTELQMETPSRAVPQVKTAEPAQDATLVVEVPDGLGPEAKDAIQGAFDKKAYQREYMRKKRAEKKLK